MSFTPSPLLMITLFVIVCLVVFSGMWIGLAGLWRTRSGGAWWVMAVGALLLTLSPISYSIGMWMMFDGLSGTTSPGTSGIGSSILLGASGLGMPSGMLLFCIGFAIHGQVISRKLSRIEELEQLATEMAGEVERFRGSQRPC